MVAEKKVRLVKVQVLADFVVDDGETLTPLAAFGLESPPVAVTAADWPAFATGPFADAVAALEAQINEAQAAADGIGTAGSSDTEDADKS
jgi:hypothetical protein